MKANLECTWDENLREIPVDPAGYQEHVENLRLLLRDNLLPKKRVSLLGELGSRLRTLGHLDEAEQKLREALGVVSEQKLGIRWEVQQKIRLAHVLQWKREFDRSNALFSEVLEVCRTESAAAGYLDFALQHGAKNLFDQQRFMEALRMFEEALRLRRQKNAPSDQIDSTEHSIKVTKNRLNKAEQ